MQPRNPSTISELIDAIGVAEFCVFTGGFTHTVDSWRRRQSIPVGYWRAISVLAARKGLSISPDDLIDLHERSIAKAASDGLEQLSAKPENSSAIPERLNQSAICGSEEISGGHADRSNQWSAYDAQHDIPGRGDGSGGGEAPGRHAGAVAGAGGNADGTFVPNDQVAVLRRDERPANVGVAGAGAGDGDRRSDNERGAA